MSITKNSNRQQLLFAYVDIALADLTSGSLDEAIDLPYGAVVAQGAVIVTEVFNSATSDVVDIGDSVDDDRYTTSPIDVTSLGRTALTPTGYTSIGNAVGCKYTGTGTAATTGALTLEIGYYIRGRAQSSMG